jgi:hypothetical protein
MGIRSKKRKGHTKSLLIKRLRLSILTIDNINGSLSEGYT